MESISVRVDAALDGQRLDKVLALCLPGWWLRARKRVWETHEVLVDGRPRPKGYLVRAGQDVALRSRFDQAHADGAHTLDSASHDLLGRVRVVAESGQWAALVKPAGLHTEAVAGRPGPSLDMVLERLWPGRGAVLLNRLDRLTSGLVLAGFGPDARSVYRALEDAAGVDKDYLALVYGAVDASFTCTKALDTADRARTRVLAEEADALRQTQITPLACHSDAPLACYGAATLVRARIHKGARHQIRAHLAHAGHPICGDPLYGPPDDGAGQAPCLHLHHERIALAGFSAACEPEWPEWAALRAALEAS